MKTILAALVNDLRIRFDSAVQDDSEFRDDVIVTVKRESIVDIVLFLRDNHICPFEFCVDVFGIDQDRLKDRFEVNYQFFSLREKVRLHLRVRLDESDPVVPTITPVFPSADWAEREAYDMYGILFRDHPDLRRIYMPEDFRYYPLRKDFPVLGIPGSLPLPERPGVS